MQTWIGLPLAALSWIGRHGTQGFALSIFLGLALPQFAAAARPLLPVTIFLFVAMTFARADLPALRTAVRRPRALLVAIGWLLLVPPLVLWGAVWIIPRGAIEPGLLLGMVLLVAAPPIMSGPAVAMMLNLEPTVLLAATIALTALAPLTSPLLAEWVLGEAIPLDPAVLMMRMVGLVGGAILAGLLVRRLLGTARIERRRTAFDGFGVVMYFLFAIAAMDGVTAAAVARPALVAQHLAVAFAIAGLGFVLAWLALARVQTAGNRFLLGYGTGQRNIGVLIAALGAATPDTTYLFFALAQFPIYLMPQIIKPLAARLSRLR